MSFGLTFDKVIVILVIAVFLVGPDRLPGYAAQLGKLAKTLRDMANTGRDRMREEMGPEFDAVDWTKLDPRQYDPRRIVREALLDDPTPAAAAATVAAVAVSSEPDDVSGAAFAAGTSTISEPKDHAETGYEQRQRRLGKGKPAPFDAEAT